MAVSAPLTPGVFPELVAKLVVQMEARAAAATTAVAVAVEREAKTNVSRGSHSHGTKTPASPGGGPAMISGTLHASIAHTDAVFTGVGWSAKTGLTGGMTPPYGRGRTTSGRYGFYLEVPGAGRSHVRYPFLLPAFDRAARTGAYALFKAAFVGFGAI